MQTYQTTCIEDVSKTFFLLLDKVFERIVKLFNARLQLLYKLMENHCFVIYFVLCLELFLPISRYSQGRSDIGMHFIARFVLKYIYIYIHLYYIQTTLFFYLKRCFQHFNSTDFSMYFVLIQSTAFIVFQTSALTHKRFLLPCTGVSFQFIVFLIEFLDSYQRPGGQAASSCQGFITTVSLPFSPQRVILTLTGYVLLTLS